MAVATPTLSRSVAAQTAPSACLSVWSGGRTNQGARPITKVFAVDERYLNAFKLFAT
jgi:hypothetical protein